MAVIAHHLVLTGYGHWLPNDPRGSMSAEVRREHIDALGDRHLGRKWKQPSREELRAFHQRAKEELEHPVLWWADAERQAIVEAFARLIRGEKLTCYACAVLQNHAHLLVRRHRLNADELVTLFKNVARDAIRAIDLAPPKHPVFSADSCHVFKDNPRAVRTCVTYIQDNHRKHRLSPIVCGAVTEYDDWPFHKK